MAQNAIDFFQVHPFILAVIKILIVLAVVAGIVAYLVYMERKVLSFMQARLGPMRVGPWGLLQPVADAIKLLLKEDIIPAGADKFVFLLAPTISVAAAFTVFSVIPFAGNFYISDINVGLLFILGVSSLGIYGIILGGWSSNSHYPLLGALRSSAQLVSYEVAAGMALVGVLLISNSLSMVEIVNRQQQMGVWNVFLQPVAFVIYLIAAVAETNRNPFDLPEAESELTAGFHTEYSGFRFTLYFLAEYTNMVVVSCRRYYVSGGMAETVCEYSGTGFLEVCACRGIARRGSVYPLAGAEESGSVGAIFLCRFGRGLRCAGRHGGNPCGVECHSGDFLVCDKGPGLSLCIHLVSRHLPAIPL